jgi:transcriptional regulator with XRE-family HTH domain
MTNPTPERSESVRRFFAGLAAVTRMIRARDELAQADVARRAGVSSRVVSDVECERANPNCLTLDKLARGLGLSGVPELVALAVDSANRVVNPIRSTD